MARLCYGKTRCRGAKGETKKERNKIVLKSVYQAKHPLDWLGAQCHAASHQQEIFLILHLFLSVVSFHHCFYLFARFLFLFIFIFFFCSIPFPVSTVPNVQNSMKKESVRESFFLPSILSLCRWLVPRYRASLPVVSMLLLLLLLLLLLPKPLNSVQRSQWEPKQRFISHTRCTEEEGRRALSSFFFFFSVFFFSIFIVISSSSLSRSVRLSFVRISKALLRQRGNRVAFATENPLAGIVLPK